MRAVVVREFGAVPPPGVALGEFPAPAPGPLEVQLAVHAVAANYVDLLVIGGKYQFLPARPFAELVALQPVLISDQAAPLSQPGSRLGQQGARNPAPSAGDK